MGLMNASQQFQMMIEDRLFPVRDCADPFIDDIIVGTKGEPGEDLLRRHDGDLRRVLDVLRNDSFVADVRKCHFLSMKLSFVGTCWGEV